MTFSQEHYLNLFNNLEQFDDNSFAELRLQTQLQNRNFVSTNGIGLYLRLFSHQIFTPQPSPIKETNSRCDATSPDSDAIFAGNNLRKIRDVLVLLACEYANSIPITDSWKNTGDKIACIAKENIACALRYELAIRPA